MDQIKIGSFLKELRKENELTQEQLADTLNVSRRTVSRWETGANLPDLPLLIELSDMYKVELRELLDGQRREADAPPDADDTALLIADKATEEQSVIMSRMHLIFIGGAVSTFLYMLVVFGVIPGSGGVYDFLSGMLLGISAGTVLLGVVITSRHAQRLKEAKQRLLERIGLHKSAAASPDRQP